MEISASYVWREQTLLTVGAMNKFSFRFTRDVGLTVIPGITSLNVQLSKPWWCSFSEEDSGGEGCPGTGNGALGCGKGASCGFHENLFAQNQNSCQSLFAFKTKKDEAKHSSKYCNFACFLSSLHPWEPTFISPKFNRDKFMCYFVFAVLWWKE